MELYHYHNNNKQRHYKSKSAAAVLSHNSHCKIIPFRARRETSNLMIQGSLQLIQGYGSSYGKSNPYPAAHLHKKSNKMKKQIHRQKRHYKNSKAQNNLVQTCNKKSKKKRLKTPFIQLPNEHNQTYKNNNKIYSSHNYRVPTNTPYYTPYHTPQKPYNNNNKNKKKNKKHTHKQQQQQQQQEEESKLQLCLSNYSSSNLTVATSDHSVPLSLQGNATMDTSSNISNISDISSSHSCHSSDNNYNALKRRTINLYQNTNSSIDMHSMDSIDSVDDISNIGVHNMENRYMRSYSLSKSKSIHIIRHPSLRILQSVSSISSLSVSVPLHMIASPLNKLGVEITYIDSFNSYFGKNTTQLGHGGQGSIFKINDSNVIKSYCAQSLGLYREIFALKHILNKDINVYIERKEKNKKAFIQFPLIHGENLMEYSQDLIQNKKTNLRECHLQALFAQLFVSLYELHSKGLIHRDIKIENVMVRADGSIEFIDFGHAIYIAKDLNSEKYKEYKLKWIRGVTEIFGTDCVLCPELKYAFYELNQNEYILYGTEIDFYSVGIMGVEIIYNVFDHTYQHKKWLQLLQKDIASNGNISGLSLKCLKFILALIDTNPSKRLKINEILTHPFLTEEVIDQLGYENWYSNDENIPFIDDDLQTESIIDDLPLTPHAHVHINSIENKIECLVKEELIKHKITLICKGLMHAKLSYYPRMQHLNKLIAIIKECVLEKNTTYPNIAGFILNQFEKPFYFQLKNYNPTKNTRNRQKMNKKRLSLHKRLYQVIMEFVHHYKIEFVAKLNKYVNIMIDVNGGITKNKLCQHFIVCMHKIIKIYSFEYKTCLTLLQIINKNVTQQNNKSMQIRQQCLEFLKFILMQYIKKKQSQSQSQSQPQTEEKQHNKILLTLKHPMIVTLIESIIKYGLIHEYLKVEAELLLKSFREFDGKTFVFNNYNNNNYNNMKINRLKKQINKKQKHIKHIKHINEKKNKSIDMNSTPLPPKRMKKNRKQNSVTPQIKRKQIRTKHLKKNKSMDMNINIERDIDLREKRQKIIQFNKIIRKRRSKSNKKPKYSGFVRESYSELPHLDDICASANDQ